MMKALSRLLVLAAILALPIGLFQIACSSLTGSDGLDDDDDVDGPLPALVTDLFAASFTDTTVTLAWTAPGYNGDEGAAARYELRRSDQFLTGYNWDEATPVPGVPSPKPAGEKEFFTVRELTPETRYFFALKSFNKDGDTRGVGNCVEVVCFQDAEVTFADANLEAAIRDQLSMPTGPLRRSDLRRLVDLRAFERGIVDLGGIEECANLRFLRLQGNLISDLSPLASLSELWDLALASNKISDIAPLAGLAGLSHLWAADNMIDDLSPLAGLHGLTILRIERNAFSDLAPLAGLTNLEWLAIGGNPIADPSPLAGLTALETLQMNGAGLTDLGFVAGMPLLSVLLISDNQITDLAPLSDLTQLSTLQASSNLITDIAPLLANTGLGKDDRVILLRNPLSATALNEQIPALTARGVTVEY